ncbi:XdhC family protein [Amycolatopsis umgeniensis]|uniref:Xanthine/CO dehydrogenase XdhC/CoxF family maturation factor n=1 Tax=Amycolatopsis umgeniensis TaxID=336628 RepID=A0A841AU59_9PSEU|nr:XdhC family protein [Amycolatopsis umgeniensis]MBB5850483.1 xanthine/CO dehydrogenase XdhC/CoxF family maturation factor [Amycolatopsis umgeniensis]
MTERVLVAVFATPVASFLLRYGKDLGYKTVLFEPDGARATDVEPGFEAVSTVPELGADADVVVTDHDRPELGEALAAVLDRPARWVGVLGNPRHAGPHVAALEALGVPASEIARVHRPVGLNIGSRTPPEIAVATLAGLLADRNGRPGGFAFQ